MRGQAADGFGASEVGELQPEQHDQVELVDGEQRHPGDGAIELVKEQGVWHLNHLIQDSAAQHNQSCQQHQTTHGGDIHVGGWIRGLVGLRILGFRGSQVVKT